MANHAWFVVTVREWLESQRLEHTPHRAALTHAMEAGDTTKVRELMAEAPFNAEQRRYLFDLLDRWDDYQREHTEQSKSDFRSSQEL